MALPASGAISFSDLRDEFGGSAPDTLSEYYRSGGLVPDNAANAGIPLSGVISLSDFYGGAAVSVDVNFLSEVAVAFVPNDASAGLKVKRDGQLHGGTNNAGTSPTYSDVGGVEWADPESATAGDDFECRLVTTTGTLDIGTADTWLAITSDRSFEVNQTSEGSSDFTGTLEIRDVATSTIQDSASVILGATVTTI